MNDQAPMTKVLRLAVTGHLSFVIGRGPCRSGASDPLARDAQDRVRNLWRSVIGMTDKPKVLKIDAHLQSIGRLAGRESYSLAKELRSTRNKRVPL